LGEYLERAFEIGYRGVDLSQIQQNEELVGESFRNLFRKEEIKRENFYFLSKLCGTNHSKEKVKTSFLKTLSELKLDYLDCFLIHSPFCNQFFNFLIFYLFIFFYFNLFFSFKENIKRK
jgi:diketogulonate reductase-like aldo/keto reductase